MQKRKLVFITGNPNKLREAKQILAEYEIESRDIDLPEMQEVNEQLIVEDKIRNALKHVDQEVFVEDVSLCLDAYKGLPGPLIKWFIKTVGRRGIVDMLSAYSDKKAQAKCYIGYGIPAKDDKLQEIHVFEGRVDGRIVEPTGDSNFGFDPIFLPEGHEKTFAEMSAEEKNEISHRKLAFDNFKKFLENR